MAIILYFTSPEREELITSQRHLKKLYGISDALRCCLSSVIAVCGKQRSGENVFFQTLVRSQNHRATQWLGWKCPPSPPSPKPCCGLVAPEPDQAAQGSNETGLGHLQGWGIHSFFCTACAIASLHSE